MDLKQRENEEQGAGGFLVDEPDQIRAPAGRDRDLQARVAELMRDGMSQAEAMDYIATRGGLSVPTLRALEPLTTSSAVQAFQAGGELVRQSHAIAELRTQTTRMELAMNEMSKALGTFRDQVMKPIQQELQFLRYNLGDKANVTVSQMQGQLQHFQKIFDGMLEHLAGKDPVQIRAIREKLGIPESIPTLAELEAEGRPAVDLAAMQASMEQMAEQNQRLLAAYEKQQALHAEQMEKWLSTAAVWGPPAHPKSESVTPPPLATCVCGEVQFSNVDAQRETRLGGILHSLDHPCYQAHDQQPAERG